MPCDLLYRQAHKLTYWEHPILQVEFRALPDDPMNKLELAKHKLAEWRDRNKDKLPQWVIEAATLSLYYAKTDEHIEIMRDIIRDGRKYL